jgi:membrane associated rhomboid family serine protease
MIPLKDINPRATTPFVTILIIVSNVVVFLYQLSLGSRGGQAFIYEFGMIPARVDLLLTGHGVTLPQALAPLFTSMFLHGGWLHIIGNMWFLWVFGDNIEDYFGHSKYLLFYLVCGIGAGLTHTLANLSSNVPAVGASGAISGVLGAYMVLYPRARVVTLIPLFIVFFTVQLPAFVILGYWFLIQFLSGLSSLGADTGGGTAWWAHIGGFILGAVLVLASRRR